MCRKKWTSIDKKLNKLSELSATIQNRIVALFLSTKFFAINVNVAIYTVILPLGVLISKQVRLFLFIFAADKPGSIQPRCRSPPSL